MSDTIYPTWRYHATEAPKLVNNAAEDEALGEGWDVPEAFGPATDAEPSTEDASDVTTDEPKKRGRKKAH